MAFKQVIAVYMVQNETVFFSGTVQTGELFLGHPIYKVN